MKEQLLHRGSVKDIYQLSEQELLFRFSDRYSIFDWGEMPDAIPKKGAALATLGKKLLSYLSQEGFPTHYLGPGTREEEMRVKAVQVPRDDISVYQRKPTNILIPLEVIYRFGAPKGSSLLKRYLTREDWINAGYDKQYQEGEEFLDVKLDFTTKLERLDRVLSETEAQALSGMTDPEWLKLKQFTVNLAKKVKSVFAQSEMKLWDGKFEFAFDHHREIMLVDSIGLDEIRLTYDGHPLSKELLRQCYLKTPWYAALSEAKKKSSNHFKEYCIQELKTSPENLASKKLQAISVLYQAVASLVLNPQAGEQKKLHEELKQALSCLVESA